MQHVAYETIACVKGKVISVHHATAGTASRGPKMFVARMLTRDLFAVVNLLVSEQRGGRYLEL